MRGEPSSPAAASGGVSAAPSPQTAFTTSRGSTARPRSQRRSRATRCSRTSPWRGRSVRRWRRWSPRCSRGSRS